MRADPFLNIPIETIDCEILAPTYPDGFNGPGYLYCKLVYPLHSIGVSHEDQSELF